MEQFAEALRMNDRVFPPYVDGTVVAACAGEHDLARRYVTKALELGGQQPHLIAFKGYADARAGKLAEAEQALEQLAQMREAGRVLHHDIAIINIALGRLDAALDALELAHRDREYLVVLIGVSPVFDPLRDQPRFQALIDDLRYSKSAGEGR